MRTIEGLARANGELHPLQKAFQLHHALQCGFCTSGILMSLSVLLDKEACPQEDKIRDVVSGHICRCTGYQAMIEATSAAAGEMSKRG
ncbi:MAG TPA: 2Fe-2S iron-sulfur cluster-binding protein [Sphingomicrobium sp.]|nr:2Fe-2S iron-sulfur cluster-binding protein [Sphingomicrobium sp.]